MIKFRAWDKKTKKIYDVHSIDFSNYRVFLIADIDKAGLWEFYRNLVEVDLLQYTGLKDKNGVEIYEGDIVKVTSEYWWEDDFEISEVRYFSYDNYPAFDLVNFNSDDMNALSLIFNDNNYKIEVIGNMYENKELLNGL